MQVVVRQALKSRVQTTGKCVAHVSRLIARTVTEKSNKVRPTAQIITRGENGLLVVEHLQP